MKRFLAASLLVCMLLTVLPRSVSANERKPTNADYLAFCAVSVFDFVQGETVQEALERESKWNADWDAAQQITYQMLCKRIASYRAVQIFDQSEQNGFYAVLFADGQDGVLAFRSSVSPEYWLRDHVDAAHDWLKNDLPIELGDKMGTQYESALEAYRLASEHCQALTVTGHSLGGAWADVVSALYGCPGVSFNAVSILDVLYRHDPARAGKLFAGTDTWSFVDHVNQYDLLAGMFEPYLATALKPYIAHKSNVYADAQALETFRNALLHADLRDLSASIGAFLRQGILLCHSLQSFVTKNDAGEVCLTETVETFLPRQEIASAMPLAGCFVELGQSGKDMLSEGLTSLSPGAIYGGDASDTLIGSVLSDVLIGGTGDDVLDGSWGDDTYLYHTEDGTDLLTDVGGNDTLVLYGTEEQPLSVTVSKDGRFVEIYAAETCIVRIPRGARASDAGSFCITNGKAEQEISSLFDGKPFVSRTLLDDAHDVWIVDGSGKTVCKADTAQTGAFGNVYRTADGKTVIDLREGYAIHFRGEPEKGISLRYQRAKNGVLSAMYVLSDITVKENFIARLTEDRDGTPSVRLIPVGSLRGDLNGNGKLDARDYLMLKRIVLGTFRPTQSQADAADLNFDGKCDARDYLMLKRRILGTYP